MMGPIPSGLDHTSTSRVSYGMFIVSISEKID